MKKENRKKKRRLLVQVSLVIVPLYLLMIAAVAAAMYYSTIDGILNAQNDMISETLHKVGDNFDGCKDAFYFDYWETHTDLNENEDPSLTELEKQELARRVMTEGVSNTQWLESQPESVDRKSVV